MTGAETNQHQQSTPGMSANQELFLSLVDTHQGLLHKVCWTYTRTSHDRDDLLQEIISRLWAAFERYDRERPFSTWMYRVALNVAIDFHRRRQRRELEAHSQGPAYDPPAPQDDSKQAQLEELHELLERQSEVDRAVLLLCLEGNAYRDISEIMGISESNVGTRLNRLKQSLRTSVHESNKMS